MKKNMIKVRKGGLDTIVAYIVVSLPLLYVLIYMVATIYHFSVQTYVTQVVKETAVMISAYGDATDNHKTYITNKLSKVLGENGCNITFYKRTFNNEEGVINSKLEPESEWKVKLKKGDIIGVQVISKDESMLGSVGAFSIFGPSTDLENKLYYSAYREEIVRNERQTSE